MKCNESNMKKNLKMLKANSCEFHTMLATFAILVQNSYFSIVTFDNITAKPLPLCDNRSKTLASSNDLGQCKFN